MSQNVFAQNGVSDAVYRFGEEVLAVLRPRFDEIDRTAEYAVDDEDEEYEQYHGFSMRM